MNFSLDPVHGKRHQTNTAPGIKAFDRFHQANIAFLNQVSVRQSIAQITASDGNHQTKMGKYQLTRRFHITVIMETLGQPDLLSFCKHWVTIRCLNISIDVANRRGKVKC